MTIVMKRKRTPMKTRRQGRKTLQAIKPRKAIMIRISRRRTREARKTKMTKRTNRRSPRVRVAKARS
jgi:hypothetical protein